MSRLRDAAAAFVEHGRWLGQAEAYRCIAARIQRSPPAMTAQGVWETGADLELAACEANAATARAAAEALMAALEHPGAVMARRLVAALRGAQAGWRGSR